MFGKIIFSILLVFTNGILLYAQDTLYVAKSGEVIFKWPVSDIDSITFVNSLNKDIIDKIALDKNFTLFYKALQATGYADKIRETPVDDTSYIPKVNHPYKIDIYSIIPKQRKFGFTIFMESDKTLANYKDCPLCPNGIKTFQDLEKLAEYMYSGSYNGIYYEKIFITDPKDKRHHLNRYIAYHCLDRSLSVNNLIDNFDTPNQIPEYDHYEFLETMLENSLIKIKKDRRLNLTNLFNMYNDADSSTAVRLKENTGTICRNGYYYELDKPLAFTKVVSSIISENRIRMDLSSLFKEFASNNIRGSNPTGNDLLTSENTFELPGKYCERIVMSDLTMLSYNNANMRFEYFEGDWFVVNGNFDISITMPKLPPGIYEVRLGFHQSSWDAITQIYWNDIPCGDPIDFSVYAFSRGWRSPGSEPNDPFGYKNDSLLRTTGFMKGPSSFRACYYGEHDDLPSNSRMSQYSLRKIIGTYTFTDTSTHKLRLALAKQVLNKTALHIDYIEFVPVDMIENEGID